MSKTILQLGGAAALSATDDFMVAQGDANLKFTPLSALVTFLNGQAFTFSQAVTISNATAATTTATGALKIAGGLGVIGDIWAANHVATAAFKISATQVVGARDTGWTAMTGTPDKASAFTTSGVTLAQLAGRVMSIQTALTTHGLLGP